MNATAKKPKRPRRPVYFRVARVADLETGEQIGALVPLTKWDARSMRDRKMHVGVELRAELKQRRNVRFHRLAHAMGALMVDQHEAFADTTAHEALKRLQRECGACCEAMPLDLGPLGIVTANMPRSIAFDELDESEFAELMQAIYRHVAAKYWPTMDEHAVEEMVLMYDDRGQA